MGARRGKHWVSVVIFVWMHCCTQAGSENGAVDAGSIFHVFTEQRQSPGIIPLPLSYTQVIGKAHSSPLMTQNMGIKQSPILSTVLKLSSIGNERKKRSLSRAGKMDHSSTTSPIPAKYIVVVKLDVHVNRTTLLWIKHAFATSLDLPLKNIGVYNVKGFEIEMFFMKLNSNVNRPSLKNLLLSDDILKENLLQDLQRQLPSLNITSLYPQHDFIITSQYAQKMWIESYFPYLLAALAVNVVVIAAIAYVCWRKSRSNKKQISKEEVYYPSIKPDTKDPSTVQPESSPAFTPKGCTTPILTQPMRMKAKGLRERRGSNASLTIDLNASPEMKRWDGTPPKESSGLEYLLSAGNRLSRRDLRNAIKNSKALHEEFWEIPMNHPEKVYVAGSGMKNRYKTIMPNEHSRVILPDSEWDPLSSYINASYIRGYDGEPHAYIATQGPMSHTIVDFWRMVWSEKTPIIVMITKLKEKERPKCENYLPEDYSSATVGDLDIRVENVIPKHGYTLRHLILKCNGEVLHVLHYCYTAWPDHKPPDSPTMLIELIKDVEIHRYHTDGVTTKGPVIVHCSAGIGRTGCFIAISIGIRQLREEHSVDIMGTVCSMRIDRGGMVQTHVQYDFVHQALGEFEKQLAAEPPLCNYPGD